MDSKIGLGSKRSNWLMANETIYAIYHYVTSIRFITSFRSSFMYRAYYIGLKFDFLSFIWRSVWMTLVYHLLREFECWIRCQLGQVMSNCKPIYARFREWLVSLNNFWWRYSVLRKKYHFDHQSKFWKIYVQKEFYQNINKNSVKIKANISLIVQLFVKISIAYQTL